MYIDSIELRPMSPLLFFSSALARARKACSLNMCVVAANASSACQYTAYVLSIFLSREKVLCNVCTKLCRKRLYSTPPSVVRTGGPLGITYKRATPL